MRRAKTDMIVLAVAQPHQGHHVWHLRRVAVRKLMSGIERLSFILRRAH